MDVLSDMLIRSKFNPAEIDKERGVIMEEYNMYQDTPMYQIGWDFERLIYGDQPLGWDQVGTKEVIMGLQQKDFLKYRQELYTPENTVVSIAGNVDHDQVVEQIEKLFKFEERKKAYGFLPAKEFTGGKRINLRNKKTEQAHVMLGFPGYAEESKEHHAAKLLAIVLGGNMSSRMFLSVREAQGLAYYISSTTDEYTDTGTFTTNAGVSLDGIDKAIVAIMQEYKKIMAEPVPAAELKKAQEFLKGKMVLRLEDSEEYAHLIGKYELLYDKLKSPDEIMRAIDKVTAKDLQRVAQDVFDEDAVRLAVIGPYEDEERFLKLLKL
jgi:predicted Zn-dependent peptidase